MQEWSCQAVEYIIEMSGHIKWIVAAKIVQGERKAKQNKNFFCFLFRTDAYFRDESQK